MTGRPRWQQLLLMLAVVAGVVGMHSVVACHPGGMDAHIGTGVTRHAVLSGDAASTMRAFGHDGAMSVPAATGAPGAPDRDPTAMHDLLHLCLAVLTALLLVAAALLLAVLALWVARVGAVLPGPRATGRRAPPPPTSVRLAQLCVLRN